MTKSELMMHGNACSCADRVLHLCGNARQMAEESIAIKRRWMRGEATDAERAEAEDSMRRAAYSMMENMSAPYALDCVWQACLENAQAAESYSLLFEDVVGFHQKRM